MVYITGDTHSDFSIFEENKFSIQSEMTKNVYLISHCCPTSIQTLLNPSYKKYFNRLSSKKFRKM